jgi:hypothetical protein
VRVDMSDRGQSGVCRSQPHIEIKPRNQAKFQNLRVPSWPPDKAVRPSGVIATV